jgi:hypothetical protein
MRLLVFAALIALAACNPAPSALSTSGAGKMPAPVTDAWLGKWQGVEGTYLELEPGDISGHYKLTIANLDGPETYRAIGVGESLQFKRDGVDESIHPGNGVDTGMKWLTDKKNCLVVKPGEGYCRD